jgi:pimeloyl-ACP methyl ester carboxylesterase
MSHSIATLTNLFGSTVLAWLDRTLIPRAVEALIRDGGGGHAHAVTAAYRHDTSWEARTVAVDRAPAPDLRRLLPATPTLPTPVRSGHAPVNGIKVWYAVFGHGAPVILLHGGLANSNYWGHQVRALAQERQVIVMDSRGHGRSTRDGRAFSYHQMAADVLAIMAYLKLDCAPIVGWSDGAVVGLEIAAHHPERVSRLFAFAPHTHLTGAPSRPASAILDIFLARAAREYAMLSTTPYAFQTVARETARLRKVEPHFTVEELARITTPTWIVDGTHDNVIDREHAIQLAGRMPYATLVVQPDVGYFSFLENPPQFNKELWRFLAEPRAHPLPEAPSAARAFASSRS